MATQETLKRWNKMSKKTPEIKNFTVSFIPGLVG